MSGNHKLSKEEKLKKLKTLIIGLGNVGFEYDKNILGNSIIFSHSQAVKKNKYYRLVAGVDKNKKKRDLFKKKYKVKVYEKLEQCLKNVEIDLAIIALPTILQFKAFENLKKQKINNIIFEKPISIKISEAKIILKHSFLKKNNYIVNYIRRYNPAILNLKQKLINKKLGKILSGFFWYKENLKHGGCHFVDLMLFFFGKPISVKLLGEHCPSPNLIFNYGKFKIYLFSLHKADYEIGKFEIQTTKSIITYADDEDIMIYNSVKNNFFKNERKLVLKNKLKYKKNVNIKYVYDKFIKLNKNELNTNLNDAFYNLKICNRFSLKK